MKESENDFKSWVIDYAHLKKWRVAHFRPAQTIKNGKVTWRTAVEADGAGFPDLCMARIGRIVFAELKSEKGRLSAEQIAWGQVLCLTPAECYRWRPSDREEIMKVLE